MRLSTTKFVLLFALVFCFVATQVLAKHDKKDNEDCDDDDEEWDDDDEKWDYDDEKWNDDNDKWNNGNDKWNDDNNKWNDNDRNRWDNQNNGQGWNTAYPSNSVVVGGSTIWSSGWPAPTNSYGQPYPTNSYGQPYTTNSYGQTYTVPTPTWTQGPDGRPTSVVNQPVRSSAR